MSAPAPAAGLKSSESLAFQESLPASQEQIPPCPKSSELVLPSGTADVPAAVTSLPKAPPKRSMSLWEANFLVAQLAGFWGRKADSHAGPDLMGHGLLVLAELVQWERLKKEKPRDRRPRRSPSHAKPRRNLKSPFRP